MIINISEQNFALVIAHINNANSIKKGGNLITYYMDDREAQSFYKLSSCCSDEFIDMVLIISNSINDYIYDEGLIIGSFRSYLRNNYKEHWNKLVILCSINKNFLEFVLDSWEENFENEKYAELEKLK